MRLVIDGKSLDSVVFSSVLNLPAQDITDRPKTTKDEQGNFVPKVDSQGRQAYRVDASAIAHDSNGSPYIDKTVSLSVLEVPRDGLKAGQFYRCDGETLVTPWVNNGRISYSITAQRLVAVQNND